MSKEQLLDTFKKAFRIYYNVNEEVEEPFAATAYFASHNEQYFLVKAAKVADIDSSEYALFALCDDLDSATVESLSEKAWEIGLKDVHPIYGHRNSDVTLYILADTVSKEAVKAVKAKKLYKSYRHSLYGWSHFRLVTIECSSRKVTYNRQGHLQEKLVGNILKQTI